MLLFLLMVAAPVVADGIVFESNFETSSPWRFSSLTESGDTRMAASHSAAYSITKGAYVIIDNPPNDCYLRATGLPATEYIHAQARMLFTNTFDITGWTILFDLVNASNEIIRVIGTSDEEFRVQIKDGGSLVYNAVTSAITEDHWYKFDFYVYTGGVTAADEAALYMDDTLVASASGDWTGESPTIFQVGLTGLDAGASGDINIDDVIIDTSQSEFLPWIRNPDTGFSGSTLGGGWQ